MESRTSPGKRGSVWPLSEYLMAFSHLFPALGYIPVLPAEVRDVSSFSDECLQPFQVAALVQQILFHRHQPFSCPGCLASLVELPTSGLPWTSLTAFAISGLLVDYHVVRLERCAFVSCTHAARTCARAVCANSHSQGQVEVSA